MEATPPPASPVPEGTAPPGAVAAASPPEPGKARILFGFAAGALVMILAFAGYRLYEKDRAETAAELVRIKAYLDARAQAEAAPAKVREQPKTQPPAASLAAARVEAKPRPPVEPAARPVPKPRPAKTLPKVQAHPQPVQVQPHPPERQKSLDRLWNERVRRECSPGFVGLICREWLKFDLCREHDAWGKASICPAAEKPPPTAISGSLG